MMIGYHVTTELALAKIEDEGLVPRCGRRAQECGETRKAVHFFSSPLACHNSLKSWFRACFKDLKGTPLVVLEVNIPDNVVMELESEGDLAVLDAIPRSAILHAYTAPEA